MKNIQIRSETLTDQSAIYDLTKLAFKGRPYAGGDEQDVINRLRRCGSLHLSLVATVDNEDVENSLVGQVTFSPTYCQDGEKRVTGGPWYALGPVSVLPEWQGQGVGSLLINTGLDQIKAEGALGCILTGNPKYYQRFGFNFVPENVPANESAEFFMVKLFGKTQPHGQFKFHPAFYEEM